LCARFSDGLLLPRARFRAGVCFSPDRRSCCGDISFFCRVSFVYIVFAATCSPGCCFNGGAFGKRQFTFPAAVTARQAVVSGETPIRRFLGNFFFSAVLSNFGFSTGGGPTLSLILRSRRFLRGHCDLGAACANQAQSSRGHGGFPTTQTFFALMRAMFFNPIDLFPLAAGQYSLQDHHLRCAARTVCLRVFSCSASRASLTLSSFSVGGVFFFAFELPPSWTFLWGV